MRLPFCISALLPLLPPVLGAQDFEKIFYMTSSETSFESFAAHAGSIDIVGPQVYSVTDDGVVRGRIDPRVLQVSRDSGGRVMPLILNPGFNQEYIHGLLSDSAAMQSTIDSMVTIGLRHNFYGWQFDFENVHATDKDRLTSFYRKAAAALHGVGLKISIAIVPTNNQSGPTPFHHYMQANWRGSFDMKALADAGDFISLMTYAQHGVSTTPGPIAGLPWMTEMLEYALSLGIPREKISLGIPTYSGYWQPWYNDQKGAYVKGAEIHHDRAMELIHGAHAEVAWLEREGCSMAAYSRAAVFEYVFLEDARSFEAKLELFRAYPGLRGISVWVLGAEDPDIWSLLRRN